jgi:large subunit ribosomal protein L24
MHIKSGDTVKIITGKDRGKTGKVLQIFPLRSRVSVEGCNVLIKHLRPRRRGEQGQRVEFPAPLHTSNVALICPHCGRTTRLRHTVLENKQKVRACTRCQQTII